MATLLPRLAIALPGSGFIDPQQLFPFRPKEIWCEIGFGGGEHLAAQAERHRDIGFLGAEPFVNGTASLLTHIDSRELTNIRIFPDDARPLLDILPDQCLDRCFVLFADPWPKSRHAERRFIGDQNLKRLARTMRSGAILRLATDHRTLGPWMLEKLQSSNDFVSEGEASLVPPADWIPTRYEQKALKAGRAPIYLSYLRL